jgi:FMN phosphatase YigB (HAD superfamily)
MKYAAFDIGNVLVNVNFPGFINKLSKTLNLSVEEATYFMNRSQKLHDLGLTVMKDELIDHLHIKSSVLRDELIEEWNNCIIPADWLLERIDQICEEHNIKIALLSNVGLEHAVRMRNILGHNKFFREGIHHFSCEVGARKPNLVYYYSFLQLHPEFHGCPYFDDLQENLEIGAKFGFKPFRFSLEDITGPNYKEELFKAEMESFEAHLIQDPTKDDIFIL